MKNSEKPKADQRKRPSAKKKFSESSWVFLGAGLLIGFLIGVSLGLNEITERAKFVAANFLSVLALIVIVAQSLIYRKQREIMEGQLRLMRSQTNSLALQAEVSLVQRDLMEGQISRQGAQAAETADLMRGQLLATQSQLAAMQNQEIAMRDQANKMGDALYVSNRASVGVHSIEWNKGAETIFVRIENIGLVPAERINLVVEILASFSIEDFNSKPGPDRVRRFLRFRLLDQDYGDTKLFRGNLQIVRAFRVTGNLLPAEIRLMEAGRGNLIVQGTVSYEVGFPERPRQETKFVFYYTSQGNFWSAGAPERLASLFDLIGKADNEYGDEDAESENPN